MNDKTKVDYSMLNKLLYPILLINDKYEVIFLNDRAKKEYFNGIKSLEGGGHEMANFSHMKCYEISHGYDKPCSELGEDCPIKELLNDKDKNYAKVVHKHKNFYYKVEAYRDNEDSFNFFEFHLNVSEFINEIEQIKFKDNITGLLNIRAFSSIISEIISDTKDLGLLALLDIHNLTYINQVHGLSIGDELIKEVARLLKETFKDTDIIARITGGEFGLFFRNIKKENDVLIIKNKLNNIFKTTIKVGENNIITEINAGATLFPEDGTNFETLYERASAALFNSKKRRLNGDVEFFNEKIAEKAENFLKAEILVDKALKENLFIFYYQPYFYTDDLSLGGFEALARIRDKDGVVYPPSAFIEYLENSSYLERFEILALENILKKIKEWNVNISMNISGRSFNKPDFMKNILSACYQVGSMLTIEVTERVIVEDIIKTGLLLNELKYCRREFGKEGICESPVKVAVDDFGTGYSSLLYLKDLPINILKIDTSFIRDITKGPKELALIKAILQFSRELGLKTIAEGVETKEQFDILKSFGCDYVQGFLLSKPVPEEEAIRFLK